MAPVLPHWFRTLWFFFPVDGAILHAASSTRWVRLIYLPANAVLGFSAKVETNQKTVLWFEKYLSAAAERIQLIYCNSHV